MAITKKDVKVAAVTGLAIGLATLIIRQVAKQKEEK